MPEQAAPKSKAELARAAIQAHTCDLDRLASILNVLDMLAICECKNKKDLVAGADNLLWLISEQAQAIVEKFDGEISRTIKEALATEEEAAHV